MKSSALHLFFSYASGVGPAIFDRLLAHFGSVEKLYRATRSDLKVILPQRRTDHILSFRDTFDPEKELKRLQTKGIEVIGRDDSWYPPQLSQLADPPICLYVKGDLSLYDHERDVYFAIVGTRSPTIYGTQVAMKLSGELARAGFVIVSGLAKGVDALAHQGALNAGGRTIAFLGCGVNIVYPPQNKKLYNDILQNGGLVISEAPPDMKVERGLFVSRNRLISGLSRGVLVAEGLKDSGSLITAKCALEQGKDVFAPPAPITSEQSAAPNMLLKEGARLVTGVEDILEEFHMQVSPATTTDVMKGLTSEEQQVYGALIKQPFTSDELARELQLPIHIVLMAISGMELKGAIQKGSAGKYYTSI